MSINNGISVVLATLLAAVIVGCGQSTAARTAATRSVPGPAGTPPPTSTAVETATPTTAPTPTATPAAAPAAAPPPKPPAPPPPRLVAAAAPRAGTQASGPVAWGLWEPQWQGPGDNVDFGQFARMDAQLGRPAGIVHWFASWDEGWDYDGPLLQSVLRANRTPMITWEAYNRPLKAIARGQYDSYIDSWAAGMAASGRQPVYLRIFHEFNDPLDGSGSG